MVSSCIASRARVRGLWWSGLAMGAACLCGQAPARADEAAPASPSTAAAPGALAPELERLRSLMTGSFSSAAQAQGDPEHFRDVRLHIVPIWPERNDGPWLYVEQAMATALDAPYRQRVYHLSVRADGALESKVFELPGEAVRFAGAWKDPALLGTVSPDQLAPRDGCTVVLEAKPDGTFAGSTVGDLCKSSLRGASYATSEVIVRDGVLETLDRGYDASGAQVWGSTAGAYRFVRDPA